MSSNVEGRRLDHVRDPSTGAIAYFDPNNADAWIKAINPEEAER